MINSNNSLYTRFETKENGYNHSVDLIYRDYNRYLKLCKLFLKRSKNIWEDWYTHYGYLKYLKRSASEETDGLLEAAV